MTPESWIAIALWIIAVISVVIAVFLIRLLIQLERVAGHFDRTLNEVDTALPQLAQQAYRTLESVELAALQTTDLIVKVKAPITHLSMLSQKSLSLFSPKFLTMIIGIIKGIGLFKKLFHHKEEHEEGE